jgi:hypothetical protein
LHLTAINDAMGERGYKQSHQSFLERATIVRLRSSRGSALEP